MTNTWRVLLAACLAGLLAACVGTASAPMGSPRTPTMLDGRTEVLWLGQSAFRIATPGGKVIAVRAQHSSVLVWKNPATGKDEAHYGGEPVGYIIELENGFRIWHMGASSTRVLPLKPGEKAVF